MQFCLLGAGCDSYLSARLHVLTSLEELPVCQTACPHIPRRVNVNFFYAYLNRIQRELYLVEL